MSLHFSFRLIFVLSSVFFIPTFLLKAQSPERTSSGEMIFVVEDEVQIRNYFEFIDQVCSFLQPVLNYPIDEHLLLRANPELIRVFENTDYYRIKELDGISVYDQSNINILHSGDTLRIPGENEALAIRELQSKTLIDINIPEFKLRIFEDGEEVFSCPVRVGKNDNRFLNAVGRDVDLRTRVGEGKIEVLHRELVHVDPVTADTFSHTRRDDGVTTLLPKIPWIEPRINGQLFGQWIHPTTNPKTLGKAYSNGCIGTREADAWRIYFYAPVGTKIQIRYDLEVLDENGEEVILPDVYFREVPEIDLSGE